MAIKRSTTAGKIQVNLKSYIMVENDQTSFYLMLPKDVISVALLNVSMSLPYLSDLISLNSRH